MVKVKYIGLVNLVLGDELGAKPVVKEFVQPDYNDEVQVMVELQKIDQDIEYRKNIENGYNDEETKMVQETHKILGINVNPTCVRVPVLRSRCESVTIEFEHSVELLSIYENLSRFSGVKIEDDKISNKFPEPINTENKFDISVGRIRHDITDTTNKTINLFLSGDQLLKGAALNSYQILRCLN